MAQVIKSRQAVREDSEANGGRTESQTVRK